MKLRTIFGLACVLAMLGACTDNPRNKQPMAHATDTITWAGRDAKPNIDYMLVIGDGSSALSAGDIIATVKTAATPSVTDAVGTQWYGWSKEITLPGTPQLWKVKGANRMEATVRTLPYAGLYDASKRTPLVTFDYGEETNTCISENQPGGGVAMMNNCKSETSGVVKLEAPCGTKNEACCPVSPTWVTDPTSCSNGLQCTTAGGLGICRVPLNGACTTLSDCVYNANACQNGVCRFLSPLGGACTTLSDCNSSAQSCTSGRCTVPNGQSCSANNQCESNNCKSGVCSIPCTQNAACTISGLKGPCAAGKWSCTPTSKICTQTVFPSSETCDNKDNDCDGTKDEGNPGGGGSCGTDVGECSAGTWQCQSGALACVGAVTSRAEVCDNRDNDCDGSADENNVCAPPCGTANQACCSGGSCNSGLHCSSGNTCLLNPEGPCNYLGEFCCNQSCEDDYDPRLVCRAGSCQYPL